MPLPIPVIAALVGAGSSGLGGGISAFGQSRAEQGRRDAATASRARLNQLMGRIQDTNYADVNQAASGQLGRADRAIQAQTAARGVRGGQAGASRDRALGQALAQLAQFKQQDQLQRQQAVGQLLQDPSFSVPSGDVDILGNTMLGALGGAAGGAAQGAGAILGNEEILKMLMDTEGEQTDASNFTLSDVVGGGGRQGIGGGGFGQSQGRQPSAVGWQGGMPGAQQPQARSGFNPMSLQQQGGQGPPGVGPQVPQTGPRYGGAGQQPQYSTGQRSFVGPALRQALALNSRIRR